MIDVIAEPPRRSNRHLIDRIWLVEGDLTHQHDVDAIVGSIPPSLKITGSLNQAIIRAAGPEVDEFILQNTYRPRPGDVIVVPPFNLPVRHLLYCVTPDWRDGLFGFQDRDLVRCYRAALETAHSMGLKKIAFPALGTGDSKFPVKRAARLGVQGILDRLTDDFTEIRIVCNREDQVEAFKACLIAQGHS